MNRDTIERAASLVGGTAIMLPSPWDDALDGYTIQGSDVVAIYDYDRALDTTTAWAHLDTALTAEDWLLDAMREIRKSLGIEPIIMRTNTKEDHL